MQEFIIGPSGKKYYTSEYVESLREANLALPNGAPMFNFIPQEGFQEKCLISEADIMIIGGKRGGGKMQPYDAKVLTPFGFTEMGKLKIGSPISNPNGQIQHVLQIFEHGMQNVYKIRFIDGSSTECGMDHLWLVKKTCATLKMRNESFNDEDVFRGKIMTTAQIIDFFDKKSNNPESSTLKVQNLLVPLCSPITFTIGKAANHKIHPYILGVLLGDGSITGVNHNGLSYTSNDPCISEKIIGLGYDIRVGVEKEGIAGVYSFVKPKEMWAELDRLGLKGKYSHNKFIPKQYKTSSIQNRIEIIQGLMDTDGYVDDRGHMSYTTTSEILAKDFQFIIRSLGGRATISKSPSSYIKDGIKIECRDSYDVYFNTKINKQLVFMPRKKERVADGFNGGYSELSNRIIGYEYVGKKQCRCITVDNPNRLYVTDEFIVTHNSRVMNMMPLYNIDVVGFNANRFRKEEEDCRDGIYKDAIDLYRGFGNITDLNIKFNNGDSYIDFGHLQNEKEIDRRFRGRQMPDIGIDELSQLQEATFFTLLGSNRNTLGIKNKFIASTNPVGDLHWLYQLVSWYINPITHKVIPERSGVIRYFYRHGKKLSDIIWGDSREEVYLKASGYIDAIYDKSLEGQVDKLNLIVSFTFIEGQLSENKILNKKDDNYLGRLATQGAEEAYRAINGIWENKESSYGLVTYEDFEKMFSNNKQSGPGFRCATADVALTGDYFVLMAFEDNHVIDWDAFTGVLSDTAVDLVRRFLDRNNIREEYFAYDSNGLGLFLEGYFKKAKKFNNKEQASNTKLWNNQKSECCEKFVKSVKDGDYSFADGVLDKSVGGITLHERLQLQRPALRRKEVESGRFEIIGKPTMKAEVGHSPDDIETFFMQKVFATNKRSFRHIGLL